MKNFVLFFLLSFFSEGAFGDSVSVTNGDSVTLHTGLTEIQEDDVLEWRFGAGRVRIARVRKDSNPTTYDDVLDGRFRGRLKPDGQTGDLTITNITTEHDGPYEMSINAITSRTFSVIVGVDEEKSVSLIVGDSVTLNSDTNIHRDDVIEWRFGDLNSLIAEHNRKTGNYSTSDGPDGRFGRRLKLDYRTGSLTIRNIGIKNSGFYEAGIRKSSSTHTIHKSYSVTASGEMKSLSVMEGDSVTLNSDLTEIQTDDVMQWMFEDSVLAEINKAQQRFSTSDDPDERFRGRLELDPQTGSLTIMNTTYTDSGLYELKIFSSRFIINKRIHVTVSDPGLSKGAIAGIAIGLLVCAAAVAAVVIYHRHKISELEVKALKRLSVMAEEEVKLIPYGIEIRKDEDIWWKFGGATIAERKGADRETTIYDNGEKFKDRLNDDGEKIKEGLKLNKDFGFLTITNITTTNSGYYELWSSRSGMKPLKTFYVSVYAKTVKKLLSVKEGGSVTLETGVPHKQKVDQIMWKFRLYDSPIAQITEGTRKISHFAAGGRFIFKLKLDQNGSLTINKIKLNHIGYYALFITNGGETTMKLFNVEVLQNNPEESDPLTSVQVP